MSERYRYKYLKYKSKYNKLLQQIGGANDPNLGLGPRPTPPNPTPTPPELLALFEQAYQQITGTRPPVHAGWELNPRSEYGSSIRMELLDRLVSLPQFNEDMYPAIVEELYAWEQYDLEITDWLDEHHRRSTEPGW